MAASATRRDLLYFTFGDKVRCGVMVIVMIVILILFTFIFTILYSNTPKIFTRSTLYYKKIMSPLVRNKIYIDTTLTATILIVIRLGINFFWSSSVNHQFVENFLFVFLESLWQILNEFNKEVTSSPSSSSGIFSYIRKLLETGDVCNATSDERSSPHDRTPTSSFDDEPS